MKKIVQFSVTLIIALVWNSCNSNKETSPQSQDTLSVETNPEPLTDCDYCEFNTAVLPSHEISLKDAAGYIFEFNTVFGARVINDGITIAFSDGDLGTLTLGQSETQKVKMHWCLGAPDQNGKSRMSLTADAQALCWMVDSVYQTNSQINSYGEIGAKPENDIPGEAWTSELDIEYHLKLFNTAPQNGVPERFTYAQIITQNENFNNDSDLKPSYPCEAVYFDFAASIVEIRNFKKTNVFRFYFGYNPEKADAHKLRVIMIGVDPVTHKNILDDGIGKSLIREFSRPKP